MSNDRRRTCVGCKRTAHPRELVRVCIGGDGKAHVDRERRAGGRGAWLCADRICFESALRRNAFGRALRRVGADTTSLESELRELWRRSASTN